MKNIKCNLFLFLFLTTCHISLSQVYQFDESKCHLVLREDNSDLVFPKTLAINVGMRFDNTSALNPENIVKSSLKAYGYDVWTLNKVSNKSVEIFTEGASVSSTNGTSSSPLGEIFISVINPNGEYIKLHYLNFQVNNSIEKYVIPADSPAGIYKVEVNVFKNDNGGYKLGGISDNSYIPISKFDEIDIPNNNIIFKSSASTDWEINKDSSFSIGNDNHRYSLSLLEGENLIIDLYNIEPFVHNWAGEDDWSSMDTKLYLLDSDFNVLVSDDDSGNNKNARIYFSVPSDGDYYIIATTYGRFSDYNWSNIINIQDDNWDIGSTGITYYTLKVSSDSSADFIYDEIATNEENSIKINAILLTNDESLNNLPISVVDLENLISKLNSEFSILYDVDEWSSFELAGITKYYNPDYYITGSPHEALANIGNGPTAKKNYLNLIFLDCDSDKTGIVGTTYLYSSTIANNGASVVLDKDISAGVLIHEIGHVIGMNHVAGTWPPLKHSLNLQDNNSMGYVTAYISRGENSHMSNWNSNPIGYDPSISLYLTQPQASLKTPTYGDYFSEGFRSWLINNNYINSEAIGTGYEGNDIYSVSSSWASLKEYKNIGNQVFSSIASSKDSTNNHAAFSFINTNNSKISYGFRKEDNSWTDVQNYSGNIGQGSVDINSKGDAIIITEPWYSDGIMAIHKSHDQEEWSEPLRISGEGNGYHIRSKFRINDEGNVAVVWLDIENSVVTLKFNELINGVWSGESIISSSDNRKELPSIDYNDNGDVIISWQEWDINGSKRFDVVGKYRNGNSQSWGSLETYSDLSNHSGFSQVAIDKNGDVIIYWREEVGTFVPNSADNSLGQLNIRYRNYDGSLENIITVSPDGEDSFNSSTEITKPRIVFENGKAAVTWWGVNGNHNVIYASIMISKDNWKRTALTTNGKSADLPSVSIGNDGLISFAWQRTDGLNQRIQSRFYFYSSDKWSNIMTLSEPGENAIHSDIASDDKLEAVASWVRYDPSKGVYIPQIKKYSPLNIEDADGDGVADDVDTCPDTPDGEAVDANGCSDSQKDTDGDGVADDVDTCPDTPDGEAVDANGCSDSQKDTDGDGVADDVDTCPDTPNGATVDNQGCPIPLFIESSTFIDNIFPNPTDNNLKITLRERSEVKDLYFIDFNGRIIKPKSIKEYIGGLDIDVSHLAEGVYILEVFTENDINKVKVIIER